MYFKISYRNNPEKGKTDAYYRLIESYRNADNRVCHRTILNVGFIDELFSIEELNIVARILTSKYERKQFLFDDVATQVQAFAEELWERIISDNRLDLTLHDPSSRKIDADTMRHSNVREVGTEWMCFNALEELHVAELLKSVGFSDERIKLAITQIISRATYPASELATTRWIKENSAVCELTDYDIEKITKDKLYESALDLYTIKDKIEQHLSMRTNDLFDIQDKIVLYDLTNTYFEGRIEGSQLAKYGRSKEKRKDAKLVVLALVVNMFGFIKYSSIHEGNMSDSSNLSLMIDKLSKSVNVDKPIVVLDAGIATEDNLKMIADKGYYYLCVSKSKLKEYEVVKDRYTVLLQTKSKRNVRLKAVATSKSTDYYLEVGSEDKLRTERSMRQLFEQRFEEELLKIANSIQTKGGIKRTDKVHQRIGRAREKYPSVQMYYDIDVLTNKDTDNVESITWRKNYDKYEPKEKQLGLYFLRTNLLMQDEVVIWNIYNTIREIEATFRVLKTELDLRPIYHKSDTATIAHLHLGLLAYWVVNTIRCKLKLAGIHHGWTEIVRIGNTQKIITTTGTNTAGIIIGVRKCSVPNDELRKIQHILAVTQRPFVKRKSVVHKLKRKKKETLNLQSTPPI